MGCIGFFFYYYLLQSGWSEFSANILDHSPSFNLIQDFDDLTLCVTALLHLRSPFHHIIQENSNFNWYYFKGGLQYYPQFSQGQFNPVF